MVGRTPLYLNIGFVIVAPEIVGSSVAPIPRKLVVREPNSPNPFTQKYWPLMSAVNSVTGK